MAARRTAAVSGPGPAPRATERDGQRRRSSGPQRGGAPGAAGRGRCEAGALYTAPEASALLRGCVRCSGSSVHYPWGSTLLQSLWALFSCCVHRSRGSVRCCHLAATLRNCSCCLSCCPLPSSRTLPAAGRLITATSQPLSASPRWLLTACVSGHTSISQGQAAQHRWPSLRGHLAGPTRSLSPSRGAGTAPSTSSQGQAASLPAALTSPALPPAFSCCT